MEARTGFQQDSRSCSLMNHRDEGLLYGECMETCQSSSRTSGCLLVFEGRKSYTVALMKRHIVAPRKSYIVALRKSYIVSEVAL